MFLGKKSLRIKIYVFIHSDYIIYKNNHILLIKKNVNNYVLNIDPTV